MQSVYRELAGCEPDDASDIGIRLKVLSGELSCLYSKIEDLNNSLFPDTASGDFLDKHAELKGLSRKPSQPSVGTLTFSRQTPAPTDLTIPAQTTASTQGANPTFFETTVNSVLKSGATSVTILAESVDKGAFANTGSKVVNLLVSAPTGIATVTNNAPFSGGSDTESDAQLKARILASYKNPANSLNQAYYEHLSANFNGVSSVRVVPRSRGVGTVDIIVKAENINNESTVVSGLRKLINSKRELGVDVRVLPALIDTVDFSIQLQTDEAYNFDDIAERCKIRLRNHLDNLPVGEGIKIALVYKAILEVSGVKNLRLIVPFNDIAVPNTNIIKANNITINSWG